VCYEHYCIELMFHILKILAWVKFLTKTLTNPKGYDGNPKEDDGTCYLALSAGGTLRSMRINMVWYFLFLSYHSFLHCSYLEFAGQL
jgi:hypothetical protein